MVSGGLGFTCTPELFTRHGEGEGASVIERQAEQSLEVFHQTYICFINTVARHASST